ncbi:MAG: hypothetical protein A2583_00645 [Bdellovibrionales bacterium RIFOXYD1_FULL_53_11]|nr:MAG: hypothetical protein A2583_00645 [Bdellovibrionales bacterium RIFOXYD1_FULL_53_11]
MLLGIDKLMADQGLQAGLAGRRVALLAHPASLNKDMLHSIDVIAGCGSMKLSSAFGPQHGMRGEKQDNMIESEDYLDPLHQIPVYSLYGRVRKPTQHMMDSFDVIMIDLQDIGCRVYTFMTTLLYVMQECAKAGKSVWILDRPNPAGRPVEGFILQKGWESFVGSGPLPMRHGLTLGETALWFKTLHKIDVDLEVVTMEGYRPDEPPGFGWPRGELAWVNPSPNATTPFMTRCYPGTVLVEGTHFSEGRGTTHPLEVVGAPDLDMKAVLGWMHANGADWMRGCRVRPCFFEPTFNKHSGKMCNGFQIHTDDGAYRHQEFKPYRIVALFLKAVRTLWPNYNIWRSFHYEYESERLAIDIINGGQGLRAWVDDMAATVERFDKVLQAEESEWIETRKAFLLYK